ncbi:MAG: hypothetical protein M1828_002458 [Chrysothrix sp. TS-e1954]|nr:MAG: hypothetical protein M1828_002458 [Chrysothrix sp. TS-e1954]
MEVSSAPPQSGDRRPGVIAAAVTLIVISTIAVLGRLWHRIVEWRFWWDDAAVLALLIIANVVSSISIWWTTLGFGLHQSAVNPTKLPTLIVAQAIVLAFYETGITLLKLAALTTYARVFKINTVFRRVLVGIGIFVVVWWLVLEIEPWAKCRPAVKYVRPETKGHCGATGDQWGICLAFINVSLDIIILVLPMPLVWKLQMKIKRKLQVSGIFFLGYCSAILSFARFVIITHDPNIISPRDNKDLTWTLVPLYILSMLEAPIAIVAVSIIPIFNLLARGRRFGLSSLFTTRSYGPPMLGHGRDDSRMNTQAAGGGLPTLKRSVLDLFHGSNGGDTPAAAPKNQYTGEQLASNASRGIWGRDRVTTDDSIGQDEISVQDEESLSGADIPMGQVLVRKNLDVASHRLDQTSS